MVGRVGAAGYLVAEFAVGVLDLVSMQVIFCFEIAQDYGVRERVRFSV